MIFREKPIGGMNIVRRYHWVDDSYKLVGTISVIADVDKIRMFVPGAFSNRTITRGTAAHIIKKARRQVYHEASA